MRRAQRPRAEGHRTFWRGHALNLIRDEPLVVSLLRYRMKQDRVRVPAHPDHPEQRPDGANLISSKTTTGRQKIILDLDFPHSYHASTKPGHGHLYLDVELPWWRWAVFMVACRIAGVVELGFVAWSLRRGGNFVRPVGVPKTPEEELRAEAVPKYGVLRRVRD